MSRPNDWFATLMYNQPSSFEEVVANGVTPNNTEIKSEDFYKNLPEVKDAFTKDGKFDETSFNNFYTGALKSYNDFSQEDWTKNLINELAKDPLDWMQPLKTEVKDVSVTVGNGYNPERRSIGITGIRNVGDPVFSIREIAQDNYVRDENGEKLDWTPNQKHGLIKSIFTPTVALAEYDEEGWHEEFGKKVRHKKGDKKLDENGNFYYEVLGNKESYGRDILRWSDTLTVDGTLLNKFDPFDSDGLTKSIGSTVMKTVLEIAPLLIPGVGEVYGTIGAITNLVGVMPTLAKAVNGIIGNDNHNSFGQSMTTIENWFGRFNETKSDKGNENFWNIENIGNILSSSARQLYQQKSIANLTRLISFGDDATRASKWGQAVSLGYLALTSSNDVYSDFKQAGASDRAAGIGMLAVTAALYEMMNQNYFREQLFKGTFMDESEAPAVIKSWIDENGIKFENLAAEQATKEENLTLFNSIWNWVKNIYSKGSTKYPWIGRAMQPNLNPAWKTSTRILNRAANEGVEETMEEVSSDLVKALFTGMDALGIPVTTEDVNKLDFGFTPEEIIKRYAATFIGGALGGATFEGIEIYNKHFGPKIVELGDKTVNQQLNYLIATGHAQELRDRAKLLYDRGVLGNKNLSATETKTTTDADGKEITIFAQGTDTNNQNLYNYSFLINQINYLENAMHQNGIYFMMNGIGDKDSIPDWNVDYKKAYEEQQVAIEEQNIKSDAEYTYYNKENALTKMIEKYKADTTYITDVMDVIKKIVSVQSQLDQLADKENSDQVRDLNKLKNELKEQYKQLVTGKNDDVYAHQTIFTTQNYINEPFIGGIKTGNKSLDDLTNTKYWMNSVQGYVKSRYSKDWKDLTEGEKSIMEEEFNKYKGNTGIDQLIWASKVHYGLLETRNETIKNLESLLKDKTLDSYYDHSNLNVDTTEFENYENNLKRIIDLQKEIKEVDAERQRYAAGWEGTPETLSTDSKYNEILTELNNLQEEFNALDKEISNFRFKYGSYTDAVLNESLTTEGWDNFYKSIRSSLKDIDDLKSYLRDLYIYEGAKEAFDPYNKDDSVEQIINEFESKYREIIGEDEAKAKIQEAYNNILNGVKGYYKHLADNNIVSESDAVLKTVIKSLIDPIASFSTKSDISDKIENTFSDIDSELLSDFTRPIVDKVFNYLNYLKNGYLDEALSLYEDLVSSTNEFLASINDSQNGETLIRELLADVTSGQDFIKFLQDVNDLKNSVVTFSAIDLIRGFNMNLSDETLKLIDYLEREDRNFHTFTDKDSYWIQNPSYKNAIKQIPSVIAMLKSIIDFSYNSANDVINRYRRNAGKEELVSELSENTKNIIASDFSYLYSKAWHLYMLSEENSYAKQEFHRKSEIKTKTDFIKNIFFAKDAEDSLYKRLSNFLRLNDGDLEKIWGDIDYKNVQVDNFSKFNTAFINFTEKLYDLSREVSGDNLENIGITVASWLPDNAWQMLSGEITDDPLQSMTKYSTIVYLATIFASRPKAFFSTLKAINKNSQFAPIIGQEWNTQIAISSIETPVIFNQLVKRLKELAQNNNIPGNEGKYISGKSALDNFMFIMGGLGTGKTQVIIRNIDKICKEWYKDKVEIAYFAPHTTQLNTLQEVTGTTNLFTIEDGMTKINSNRPKTNEDVIDDNNHSWQLDSDKVIVNTKLDAIFKNLNSDVRHVLIIDEATFINEADLQLLTAWAKENNVSIIAVGDRKQNGAKAPNGFTSGIEDCLYITGPELTESIRMKVIAKAINIRTLATPIKQVLDQWRENPSLHGNELNDKVAAAIKDKIELVYYENGDRSFVGEKFIDPKQVDDYIEKFKKLSSELHEDKKPSVAIITEAENVSKYKDMGVTILSSKEAQGGEFDYVIIDKDFFKENSNKFNLIRDFYTLIGRSSYGTAIVGNLKLKDDLNIHNNPVDSSIKDTPTSFADDAEVLKSWKMEALESIEDIELSNSESTKEESSEKESSADKDKLLTPVEIAKEIFGSDYDDGSPADIETTPVEIDYKQKINKELDKVTNKLNRRIRKASGKYSYNRADFLDYIKSDSFLLDDVRIHSILNLIEGDEDYAADRYKTLVKYISSAIMFNFKEISMKQGEHLSEEFQIEPEIINGIIETLHKNNRTFEARAFQGYSIIYLKTKIKGEEFSLPIAKINKIVEEGIITINKNTPLFNQIYHSDVVTAEDQIPIKEAITHGHIYGEVRIFAIPQNQAYTNGKFAVGINGHETKSVESNSSFYNENLGKTFIAWSESEIVTDDDLSEIFQYDIDETTGKKVYMLKVDDIIKDRKNQKNDLVYTLKNGAQIRLIQVSRQIDLGFAYDIANLMRFVCGQCIFNNLSSKQKSLIGDKNDVMNAIDVLKGVFGDFSLDLSVSTDPKKQREILASRLWKMKSEYKLFSSDNQRYFFNAVYTAFVNNKNEHPTWYSGFLTNLFKAIYHTPIKSKSTSSTTQIGLRIDFNKLKNRNNNVELSRQAQYNENHTSYFVKFRADGDDQYLDVYKLNTNGRYKLENRIGSISAKGVKSPLEDLITLINESESNEYAKYSISKQNPNKDINNLLAKNNIVISFLQENQDKGNFYYNEPNDYDYLITPFNHIQGLDFAVLDAELRKNDQFKHGIYVNDVGGIYQVGNTPKNDDKLTPWRRSKITLNSKLSLMSNIAAIVPSIFELNPDLKFEDSVPKEEGLFVVEVSVSEGSTLVLEDNTGLYRISEPITLDDVESKLVAISNDGNTGVLSDGTYVSIANSNILEQFKIINSNDNNIAEFKEKLLSLLDANNIDIDEEQLDSIISRHLTDVDFQESILREINNIIQSGDIILQDDNITYYKNPNKEIIMRLRHIDINIDSIENKSAKDPNSNNKFIIKYKDLKGQVHYATIRQDSTNYYYQSLDEYRDNIKNILNNRHIDDLQAYINSNYHFLFSTLKDNTVKNVIDAIFEQNEKETKYNISELLLEIQDNVYSDDPDAQDFFDNLLNIFTNNQSEIKC